MHVGITRPPCVVTFLSLVTAQWLMLSSLFSICLLSLQSSVSYSHASINAPALPKSRLGIQSLKHQVHNSLPSNTRWTSWRMCTLGLPAKMRNMLRRRARRRGGPRSLCRQARVGFGVVLPLVGTTLFDYGGILHICMRRTG